MAGANVVADVGQTLVSVVAQGLSGVVQPVNIFMSTPDAMKELSPRQPTVTIFLYHVSVNAELRNNIPRPLNNGTVGSPTLPLDLRYFITPWAKDTVESHRIAGYVLRTLYVNASLGPGDLVGDWDSDDSVQLVLEALPVEQHYDIWDATGIPYRLSLSYLARVIGLDAEGGVAQPPVVSAQFGGRS